MLSFMFGRTLLRSAIFPIAQKLPTRAVLSNRCLALSVRRNFVTTASNRDSGSTTTLKPEPKSKSKTKSTRRKTGSSTKASGKGKGRKVTKRRAKVETKKKVVVGFKDKPPKAPSTPYTMWLVDWYSGQPKVESREAAQEMVKKASQVWHTVSEYDKQQYREKYASMRADYKKRLEEWRARVDPRVLREMNRRRVAKGLPRIRGPPTGRPMTGYLRHFMHVRTEYPRTDDRFQSYFTEVSKRASSQWKAMSDAEKAKYNDPAHAEFAAWSKNRMAESQVKQ